MTKAQSTAAKSRDALPQEGLLAQIMAQTRLEPSHDGYSVAERGVAAFIAEALKSKDHEQAVNKQLVDSMIAEIDLQLSKQLDQILHSSTFQEIESTWRGLHFVVFNTDFRENIYIEALHATKEELLDDFESAGDITRSGLYKHAYTAGYGQFGGQPVACIASTYTFGPSAPDIKLLSYAASVGAMAHAPFLGAAGPQFLNIDSFEELPNLKDVKEIHEGPQFAKWRSLRESEDSRYLGLPMLRYLQRAPYDPLENPVRSFNYRESIDGQHSNYLWGSGVFRLVNRITDSFARYRWCPNIIGPQSGGAIEDLPVHLFESLGQLQAKIPTEVLVSDRREFELSEAGFIPLTMRKDSDNAAFFSANSVQKPKLFQKTPEGQAAQTNYALGTQLPYLFIVCRVAHYLKVLLREQIGSWKERPDVERELNTWLRQYVADQENPSADVRSRRPLRQARVVVEDVPGNPGWYRSSLSMRPHFKFMGSDIELSLEGRLDKE
ncbi:TPA: type VI secretion system contractile sheath large subunit [Pseudomonas aeruginosa]|nr:type VI secretion system contractile sheath large subunit [Pseudomonas aeruginosa]